MTEPADTSLKLDDTGVCQVQQIVGTALYNARAVSPAMLAPLSALASEQSMATEQIADKNRTIPRPSAGKAGHSQEAIANKTSNNVAE